MDDRFELEALDDDEPFEIDDQAAHLFKHAPLGVADVRDVWASDPLFYPAKPPAHWPMVAESQDKCWSFPSLRRTPVIRRAVDLSAAT